VQIKVMLVKRYIPSNYTKITTHNTGNITQNGKEDIDDDCNHLRQQSAFTYMYKYHESSEDYSQSAPHPRSRNTPRGGLLKL